MGGPVAPGAEAAGIGRRGGFSGGGVASECEEGRPRDTGGRGRGYWAPWRFCGGMVPPAPVPAVPPLTSWVPHGRTPDSFRLQPSVIRGILRPGNSKTPRFWRTIEGL